MTTSLSPTIINGYVYILYTIVTLLAVPAVSFALRLRFSSVPTPLSIRPFAKSRIPQIAEHSRIWHFDTQYFKN